MNLPSEKQCMDWFEEFKVPRNILQHCLKVREVTRFLAHQLNSKNIPVNLELAEKAALLHDLFKVVSIRDMGNSRFHSYVFSPEEIKMREELKHKYPQLHEGEISYLFFSEKYPELALTIKRASSAKEEKISWEEIIVHYADWRVFRSEIVSLNERLDYLREAYPGREASEWHNDAKLMFELEKKIMAQINLSPEKLTLAMVK